MNASIKATLGALALGMAASSPAQNYPSRPITVIFPYPTGTADVALRGTAAGLEKILGQSIVIDNRAGGNEIPAMQAVLNAPADGYTMAAPSQNFSLNPSVQKLPYTNAQFMPISQYVMITTPFLVRDGFPAKTIPEFIAYAKANPGKINVVSVGNYHKVIWTVFEQKAGIQITQVPYKGGPEQVAAILSGEVDVLVINLAQSLGLSKDGKVRIMAVTGMKRMPDLPNVPTIAETVPGFNITYWQGFLAKTGTPRAIVDRWASAVREAVKLPEVIKVDQNVGYIPVSQTPRQMADYIKNETETLARAAKQAGIVPE